MTIPDKMPAPVAESASAKPSLMAGASAPSSAADAAARPMRMLDALGVDKSEKARRPPAYRFPAVVLALALVGAGAIWGWTQLHEAAPAPPIERAVTQVVAQAVTQAVIAPAAVEPASSGAAASAVEGPVSVARVEPLQEATATASTPSASAAARAPDPVARRTRGKVAKAPQRATATVVRPPAVARPVVTARAPASAGDPDVTLLSAMLARLSGEPERPAAAHPTTARLVERCNARATRGSMTVRECRRRVCAGSGDKSGGRSGGKSDACPTALAPKKH